MARARTQDGNSVSLFPFLAVLMCAMGALILLLLVITRRVRQQAIARAVSVRQPAGDARESVSVPPDAGSAVVPTLPELDDVVTAPAATDRIMADWNRRVEQADARLRAELKSLRKTLAELSAKQQALTAELTAGQKKLDQTRAKLRSVLQASAGLKRKSDAESQARTRLETEIREQVAALDGLRRKLKALKLKQAQASSKFSIIPFDGRTGTTRRPIFVECTKDALRILPEGVEIQARQIAGFTVYHNPLIAGVRSLMQYWISRRRPGSGEPSPYVLLLVRPGGSVAYYAARKMLRNLGEPIGYELIEDDWELKLPDTDPRAKTVCEAAVKRVLESRPASAGSLYARGHNGTGAGGLGSGTAKRGSVTGRQMRFNRATGRFETIEPDDEPSLGPFGAALAGRNNGTGSRGIGDGRGPGGSGTAQPKGKSPTASPEKIAQGTHGTGFRKTPPEGTRWSNSGTASNSANQAKSSDPKRPGSATTGSVPRTRLGNRWMTKQPNGQPGGHPDGTAEGTPQNRGGGKTGRESIEDKLWPLKRGNAEEPRNSVNGKRFDGATADNSGTGSQTSSANPGALPTGPNGGQTAGGTKRQPPNAQTQRGSGFSPFGVQRGGSSSAHSGMRSRRRWGLFNPGATIGFEKEIQVWATSERLFVGRQRIRVGNGETKEQLLQNVVVAIAREVRAWGKPPDSFYWVPRVRFIISPGGNRHYGRLRSSLHKLGLQTSAEYRLETPREQRLTK